jgi:wobble nucleotide-excising tRNase
MIIEIQEIKNLGKYENVSSSIQFEKSSLMFGFNGTGKSTLSDMFYSMSQNNDFSLDNVRTTLKRSESEEKRISVKLKTDLGIVEYEQGKWNKNLNVRTFNERYIDDYVMVPEKFNINALEITLSKDARKLVKRQNFLEERMQNESMPIIKACLISKSDIFKNIKKIGEVKSITKKSTAKITAFSEINLYSEAEQIRIKEELESSSIFFEKIRIIEKCKSDYNSIAFKPSNLALNGEEITKLLRKIPRTSSKLIAEHMEKYMKNNNISWLLAGYYNQGSDKECPYCGQPIKSEYSMKMAKELERFTAMKGMENAKEIRNTIETVISSVNGKNIADAILKYNLIIDALVNSDILTKREKSLFQIEIDVSKMTNDIAEFEKLLWTKHNDIFDKITLSIEHKNTIYDINRVFKKLQTLKDLIDSLLAKYQHKLMNDTIQKEKGAILLLSNSANRNEVAEGIDNAKQYLMDEKEIVSIKKELDNLSGNVRTDRINEFLKQMNVKFSIYVKDKKFYVKLKEFLPELHVQRNSGKNIFSDGDARALAFAYFMSEIDDRGQTIVIDDPISSLDLNRKCIMAYLTVNLMKNTNHQVIILTHDITFAERVCNYYESKDQELQKYELINQSENVRPLVMEEYLKTDEKVYEAFINNARESTEFVDKILGLMSLRAYSKIKGCSDEAYKYIEERSTFFTHTIYAQKGRIKYNKRHYNVSGIRVLLKRVCKEIKVGVNEKTFIPDDFGFSGYDYSILKTIYNSVTLETVSDARKKALIMRPLLEACLVKLVKKSKIDPEHIGAEYERATKNGDQTIRKYAIKLQGLYRITCKYHHGMDSGSTLGIAWINSDEIEFMDSELQEIMGYIDAREMLSMIA